MVFIKTFEPELKKFRVVENLINFALTLPNFNYMRNSQKHWILNNNNYLRTV